MHTTSLPRRSLSLLAIFTLTLALNGVLPASIQASSDPMLVGGATVTAHPSVAAPITDVQLSGTGNPTVPVKLIVSHGTLAMGTTTGLTFTGSSTGSTLQFSGTLSADNAALSTLTYTRADFGSDTLEVSLIDPNQIYFPDNGHLYEVVSSTLTWTQAKAAADALTLDGTPGYLATITSNAENTFVSNRLSGAGWFGASDAAVEGAWKWVEGPENGTQFWSGTGTGSSVGGNYANWNTGEPNDSGGNEDCAQFLTGGSGQWNDLPCTTTTLPYYVAEFGSPGNLPTVSGLDVPVNTVGSTDTVTTCAQLNTIGQTSGDRYDVINLANDIDCTGVSVTPLFTSSNFYGTLNGQGHKITNLTISKPSDTGVGLFYGLDHATVENLTLDSGSVSGASMVGAVAGRSYGATLTDVVSHLNVSSSGDTAGGLLGGNEIVSGDAITMSGVSSTGTVTAGGETAGGLIGYVTLTGGGSLTLQQCYQTGAVTAGSDTAGGLVAYLNTSTSVDNAAMTIQDCYAQGSVNGAAGDAGGIIGNASVSSGGVPTAALTIRRVYASGNIASSINAGGIIGTSDALPNAKSALNISDSFVVSAISSNPASSAALIGANGSSTHPVTVSNNFYDQTRVGLSACAGANALACTAVNTDGSQADYFKDNTTAAPLTSWDFTGIWGYHSGLYPNFNLTPDPTPAPTSTPTSTPSAPAAPAALPSATVENAAPNGGDANSDGVADSQQSNVASYVDSVTDQYATLAVPSACAVSAVASKTEAQNATADAGFNYPLGLMDFTMSCGTPGYKATVTQYYFNADPSKKYVLRKFTSSYSTMLDGSYSQVTVGGVPALKVTYTVTDGSSYDNDKTANGIIVDPAGAGVAAVGIPNTGLGGRQSK